MVNFSQETLQLRVRRIKSIFLQKIFFSAFSGEGIKQVLAASIVYSKLG
jgi:hypothetical protein